MVLKKKRFFFHFRKATGDLTIHWNKKCVSVKDIKCFVPVESKWNSAQPFLVMRGWATEITIENNVAAIK